MIIYSRAKNMNNYEGKHYRMTNNEIYLDTY